MTQPLVLHGIVASPLVRVSQDASGNYSAQVVGLPEVQATAATREEAIAEVHGVLSEWLSAGQLVPLTLPRLPPTPKPAGWARDDLLEQEFLADLARQRQEDLERTLREDEQEGGGCSDTCSTPTT